MKFRISKFLEISILWMLILPFYILFGDTISLPQLHTTLSAKDDFNQLNRSRELQGGSINQNEEILINFGSNNSGASWNNVTADQMNSGSAISLKTVSGNDTEISLVGFGHLDETMIAYDSKEWGVDNQGAWNSGALKGAFNSSSAQEFILFQTRGFEIFIAFQGLDPLFNYQFEILTATENVELDELQIKHIESMEPAWTNDADRDVNGSIDIRFGINTKSEGWESANWLVWNSIKPGVQNLNPLFQLGEGNGVVLFALVDFFGYPDIVGGSAAINAIRIKKSGKIPQTIIFSPNSTTLTMDQSPVVLDGEASSGLPVFYTSSNPEVAAITDGNTLTLISTGVTTITASQPGDEFHLPADPVSVDLTVEVKSVEPSLVDPMAAAGFSHSLFLKADGTLWACGSNQFGQLGDGTLNDQEIPVKIAESVQYVAAHGDRTIFILQDGSVFGCGSNESGALGLPNIDGQSSDDFFKTPVRLPAISEVIAVECSTYYNTYLGTNGSVWLSTSPANWSRAESQAPHILYEQSVVQIKSSEIHTLFLKNDGTVETIGYQIGYADGTDHYSDIPLPIGIDNVVSCAAGNGYSLFIKGDQTAWAVGNNRYGQLGDRSTTSTNNPIKVMDSISQVFSTGSLSFFIHNNLGLTSVAGFSSGGSGSHLEGESYGTLKYLFLEGIQSVTGSPTHTIFLDNSASWWSAGLNRHGQLGIGYAQRVERLDGGIFSDSHEPVPVYFEEDTLSMRSLAPGGSHYLLVTVDGTAWSVGENSKGQLGTGDFQTKHQPVSVMSHVSSVAAGNNYSLFLKEDGTLWACGSGENGQLGSGDETDINFPAQVASEVVAMVAGHRNSLIVKSDHTAWISSLEGWQMLLDDVHSIATNPYPNFNSTGNDWISDNIHVLFLKQDGALWGMGDNSYGQLGSALELNFHETPKNLQITDVKEISAGQYFSAFITNDGRVWTMGSADYGQLGLGATEISFLSEPTSIFENASNLSCGRNQLFLIDSDSAIWATGSGDLGLGNTSIGSNAPLKIISDGVISLSAGHDSCLFSKRDGTVWSLGRAKSYTTIQPDGESTRSSALGYLAFFSFNQISPSIPNLKIEKSEPGTLELMWQNSSGIWLPEFNSRLGLEQNWQLLDGKLLQTEDLNQTSVVPENESAYFRLRKVTY